MNTVCDWKQPAKTSTQVCMNRNSTEVNSHAHVLINQRSRVFMTSNHIIDVENRLDDRPAKFLRGKCMEPRITIQIKCGPIPRPIFVDVFTPNRPPAHRGYTWGWNMGYLLWHDDVIKWKYFPRYWPFVRGIHRSPVNSPHRGQWRGTFMFSLICARINGWVNNCEAGDLRRIRPHYDVTVMIFVPTLE